MSKPTVCVVTKEVCAAIVKILLPKYIRIPTGDGLKVVIEGFKDKLGFPQCVGVVDGTHIPIVISLRACCHWNTLKDAEYVGELQNIIIMRCNHACGCRECCQK